MRLLTSPASPYSRKVRIVAHLKGLSERIEEVTVATQDDPPELLGANPLGRIPTLIMENGVSLYDSRVICEVLDSLGTGDHLIPHGAARVAVLKAQALGDGICDSALPLRYLKADEAADPNRADPAKAERLSRQILRGVGAIGPALKALPDTMTLGHIALGCALGYLDYRLADLKWRDGNSEAMNWYMAFASRPAMQATMPKN